LLPREAELARRAAGGDGAAFVRLYDQYSAEVFEAALNATGSVEKAADATQVAFLRLLRRPPAMDAPDSEVGERLHAIARSAMAEAPMKRRTPDGAHQPADAGVGWLRSETVAKAGAHFDEDWSPYLSGASAPIRAAVGVSSEMPVAAPPPQAAPPARRRRRLSFGPLPSRPALASLFLLAIAAAAVAAIVAGSGDDRASQPRAPLASKPAKPGAAAATPAKPNANARRRGVRERARRGGGVRRGARARRGVTRTLGVNARGVGLRSGGAPRSGGTRIGGGTQTPVTRSDGTMQPTGGSAPVVRREDAAIGTPAPAEPTPSEPAPAESAPAPAPAPTRENAPSGGANRNCNSKHSSNPC
jgi:DNA-directed RNA polymerase specialized sigma24 family protein